MVTTFKGLISNVYNHNGAKHEKTTFFKKKIYKGLYKVKMDIYKCPNPKKILEIYFGKKRDFTFKLLLLLFVFILKFPYLTWSQKCRALIGKVFKEIS